MKIEQHYITPIILAVVAVIGIICTAIVDVSRNEKEVPCHESR